MVVSFNKASLFFGGRAIFNEISFQINPGDRIGLVGRNGAGKSTLLKLIAGDYSLDEGSKNMAKEVRIGFLRQDLAMDMEKTIMEIARSAFDEIMRINERMEEINKEFEVIEEADLFGYFLIVRDIINYAIEQGWMVGPGRGSAAGCLISYLIGITEVDPIEFECCAQKRGQGSVAGTKPVGQ